VNDHARPRRGPRARPVAEAPVEVLLARAEELARSWAIALILLRPLERIGEIPLGDLAREGPALCAQAVRALESEAELERMPPARASAGRDSRSAVRRLGALAGARDARTTVEAVEALRGVLWEALMDELREPSARQVAELSDRLAYVCATILDAALEETLDATATRPLDLLADRVGLAVAGSGRASPDHPRSPTGPTRAILVDEQEDVPLQAPTVARPHERADAPSQAHPSARPHERADVPSQAQPIARPPRAAANPLPWDLPAAESSRTPEFEIAGDPGEQGPAAWIGSIGRQLERFGQDGLPFAVLLVELFDAERPASPEPSGELSSVTSQVERALQQELGRLPDGPAGPLTRERPGRYWLLAPGIDGVGARALAERLTRAVRQLRSARGGSLDVAVGTAVCPEDGRGAAALAAHADIGLLAAHAAGRASTGRPIALVDDPV
jgi:hypothetical protein